MSAQKAVIALSLAMQLASTDRIIKNMGDFLMEDQPSRSLSTSQCDAIAHRLCQLSRQRYLVQHPCIPLSDVQTRT